MIIVTRPGQVGIELVTDLQVAGFTATHLPLFEIKMRLDAIELQNQLDTLRPQDAVIAVSPQIIAILKKSSHPLHFSKQVHYFAVGEKTALLLQTYLAQPVNFPHQENSEGLLNHALLQNVHEKRILILRGISGREQLATILRQRGALVSYITCYQCVPIEYQPVLCEHWPKHSIITVTSGQCVLHLNELVRSVKRSDFTLIASSERIAKQATAHNWPYIVLSKSANNQILFKTIRTLCHNGEAEDQTG